MPLNWEMGSEQGCEDGWHDANMLVTCSSGNYYRGMSLATRYCKKHFVVGRLHLNSR